MRCVNNKTILILTVVVCLSAAGCSATNNDEPPAAARQTGLNEQTRPRALLEDGVYPVVPADAPLPKGESEVDVVELASVPVEGSETSSPETIRVIGRPLLRFGSVSHFDFTFENNECTEVGFQNTDELKAYTRDHVGSRLAVVIDNRVISHHKIREPIESAQVRITCCTVGGGDHLYKHLKHLKLAAGSSSQPKAGD